MGNLRHDNALVDKVAGLSRLLTALGQGRTVVAVTAMARDGDGFRLLLWADGSLEGGGEGGLLEACAVDRLRALSAAPWKAVLDETAPLGRLQGEAAAVYGGIERVFFERITPDPATRRLFEILAEALAAGRPGVLLSRPDGAAGAGRAVLLDGRWLGDALPGEALAAADRCAATAQGPVVLDVAGQRYVVDPYRPWPPVFLAGAGQISRCLAGLAVRAGFRVVVLDSEARFANRERFPDAHEVTVVPGFVDCFGGRTVAAEASVVVVTRGHAFDLPVLAQALATPAGYVGLLACKADGRARLEALARQGLSGETLARVRTPVGLPLGGKQPFEIALSIAAELVAARSARRSAARAGRPGA